MYTWTMTVDTSGEALVAKTRCTALLVGESGQTGTAAWTYQTTPGADAITVPAGALRTFTGVYQPGATVTTLKAVSGSMTFAIQETDAE